MTITTPQPAQQAAERAISIRPAGQVMRLSRLGSFFPHRLSFMRILMRRLCAERSELRISSQSLDKDGYGHMVLTIQIGGMDISLIAYSRALDAEDRTDRVIATKWDASFCLFDGVPDQQEIDRLAGHVSTQEAGRYHDRILCLSRANKSVRLFAHVVQALADGRQPDHEMLVNTGYLMRTTAVYGNGKFGIADRSVIAGHDVFQPPFQIEMLAVFMIREYSVLLAEWCATQQSAQAVALDAGYRRYLGIGNSTGLGMAPFLVNHPCLVHSWMIVRETALMRCRTQETLTDTQHQIFADLLKRTKIHLSEWQVGDEDQTRRTGILRTEFDDFLAGLNKTPLAERYPLEDAFQRISGCSEDMQELMVSLLIEICADEVDGLSHCLSNDFEPRLDTSMRVSELAELVERDYRWACDIDLSMPEHEAQFWYVSAEKLEPRLGLRFEEEGADKEMPFHIVRYIRQLRADMRAVDGDMRLAHFMLAYPHNRHIIRRIQTVSRFAYGEIRDNLVADSCRPIDLLRCKLSFFGASKFDPKSDRWTRVTLFQGAPIPADIAAGCDDDWLFATSPPPPQGHITEPE